MTKASLTPEEFVQEFVALKDGLVQGYMNAPNLFPGGAAVEALGLSSEQRTALSDVLDTILKDALYTVLLALDGEVPLGARQIAYTLRDGQGNLLSGLLAGPAFEAFQE
ncbi:MAG TPA: hypothetical protein VGM29_15635 [Polyangiaceae bacterium]|jgi:hypothetical protein